MIVRGGGCRIKPATDCSGSDSKYLAVPDRALEVCSLTLSMVCDEEVVSTGDNNKHSTSTLPSAPTLGSQVHRRPHGIQPTQQLRATPGRTVKTVCLSRFELEGLEAVVEWLAGLPAGKRNVPKDIPEPDVLLSDVRVSTTYSSWSRLMI